VLIEHSIFGRRTVRLGFWTKSELCSSTLISSGVHDDRTHMGHHFGHHATDAFTHIPIGSSNYKKNSFWLLTDISRGRTNKNQDRHSHIHWQRWYYVSDLGITRILSHQCGSIRFLTGRNLITHPSFKLQRKFQSYKCHQ